MTGTPSPPGISSIGKCFAAVQSGIFHKVVLSQIFLLVLMIILSGDFFSPIMIITDLLNACPNAYLTGTICPSL